MSSQSQLFSSEKILDILSLSRNATAIYTGEDIIIQTANDAMIRFWGRDRSVIGKPMAEAIPELIGQPFIPILQQVWRTGITYNSKNARAELLIDGKLQTFYFDFEYRAILNDAGKTECILHTATDVTELFNGLEILGRERTLNQDLASANENLETANQELATALEELNATNEDLQQTRIKLEDFNYKLENRVSERTNALLRAESRLLSILEQAPLAFCVLDGPDLIIEMANNRILKLWDRNKEVIGQRYGMVRSAPETAPYLKILANVYETGIPYVGEEVKAFTAPGRTQQWGYFNFTYQPIKTNEGNVTAILIIVEDVTDKVIARQNAERANAQLSFALEAAEMGSWRVDIKTGELNCSPRFKELFGFNPEDVVTQESATAQIAEEYRGEVAAAVERAISNGNNYDFTYVVNGFRNGRLRWVRAMGSLSYDASGEVTAFTGVVMDITEQVQTQQKIQTLNNELSAINEELTASNEELNELNTEQSNVNHDLAELIHKLNLSQDELQLAINAANLATFDLNPVSGKFIGNDRLKSWFGLLPEDEIELDKATDVIVSEDRERVIAAIQQSLTFEGGGDYDTYYTILNPLNPVPRIVNAKGKALFNDQQQPIRLSGVLQDVTDLKQEEQRKNDFIGMVSHELKTPLTSLTAYLQMLQIKAKKGEDTFTYNALEKANRQVKKMTSMINSFLNVSRLESSQIHIDLETFNMASLIKEVEQEYTVTISSHQIIFSPVRDIFINADRDKIGQVVNNFISNAVKYSPNGSVIKVTCVKDGNKVEVCVEDQGMGIKPEDHARLFERYYRVKNQPSTIAGFGIGLYVCAEIIRRHKGKIWVESEIGKGSTFCFSLPA